MSSSDSDSDGGNIITASNYGQKKSIAALSAKEVLAAAEEQRRKEALRNGSDNDDDDSDDEQPAAKPAAKGAKSAFKHALVSSSDDDDEEEEAPVAKKGKAAAKGAKSSKSAEPELKINAAFAAKFEEEKRKQTLSKKGSRGDAISTLLREAANAGEDIQLDSDDEMLGDVKAQVTARAAQAERRAAGEEGSDDESGESEDEDGGLLTSELNAKISDTLRAIREKKPEVYDPSRKYFTEEEMEERKQKLKAEKAAQAPKQTVTQLMAQQLLAKDSDDSASDDDGGAMKSRARLQQLADRPANLTYSQQQQQLKDDFLKSAKEMGKGKAKESSKSKSSSKKRKAESSSSESEGDSDEEDEEDEEMFKVKKTIPAGGDDDDEPAAASATGGKKSKAEKDAPVAPDEFLNSYLSQEWWREKDLSKLPTYKSIKGEDLPEEVSASEDEAALDDADTYESAYNFRFQEPGDAYQIKSYPRQIEDTLRKEDNKRKAAREALKARKAEEALKKKEEIKRLKAEKRKDIAGKLRELESITGLKDTGSKLDINQLLNNWDPNQHDAMMAQLFDADYQDDLADADMDEEALRELVLQGEDLESMGYGKLPTEGAGKKKKGKKGKKLDEAAAEQFEAVSNAVKRSVGDLQQLDFEDLIGSGSGLTATRFRYKEVKPDSHGLSLADILEKPDAELNSKVSLKKLATYRDEGTLQRKHIDAASFISSVRTSTNPRFHQTHSPCLFLLFPCFFCRRRCRVSDASQGSARGQDGQVLQQG